MHTLSDIHHQFASAFPEREIQPIAYLLSKRLQQGHVCLPTEAITDPDTESPYPKSKPDLSLLQQFISDGSQTDRPFIHFGGRFYLQRYFRYESAIIDAIETRIRNSQQQLPQRLRELEGQQTLLAGMEADYPTKGLTDAEKTDWQKVAVIQAMLANLSIITGGPGTGKTTTLAKLLRLAYALYPEIRIALAAPTGKASMRMAESLRRSAKDFPNLIREKIAALKPSTLHTLLGYLRESIYFKHNEKNPLPFDLVVVDEASMIDMPLFAKLLAALAPETRLILLGDKDQLASVEAGSLLGDLCNTVTPINQLLQERADWINNFITDPERKIAPAFIGPADTPLSPHLIELQYSHRFQASGAIGKLSRAVIQSDEAALSDMIANPPDPSIQFDTHFLPETLDNFITGYEDFIREPDIREALRKLNDIRVLAAVRDGEQGLYALNKKIEDRLRARKLLRPDSGFYENRPVMVTRNNYEIGLFNGDVGLVRPNAQGQLRVWFETAEGELRDILPAYLTACETVFAMTIHKSQGSEFSRVLVVLPEKTDTPILSRELLYTAITRTKEKLTIQGSIDTLLHAARKTVSRISGIPDRLKNNP